MADEKSAKMFLALLDEGEDTLRQFEKHCLRLDVDDTGEELQACFRLAHNLKGAVQIFGLQAFGEVVHQVEDLIGFHQRLSSRVDNESIDALLRAHSFLLKWVELLRKDSSAALDTTSVIDNLRSRSRFAKERSEDPKFKRNLDEQKAKKVEVLTIAEMLAMQEQEAAKPSSEPKHHENSMLKQVKQSLSQPNVRGTQPEGPKKTGSLRIPSEKVDQIMQVIGELSIHQSILWHGQQTNSLSSMICSNAILLNQKLVKDLQNMVLALRMQPMEALFQRMERTARETSRELGKKVQVEFTGADVLLDKTMIELMTDSMNHIIRNAVDHGIETESERAESGKNKLARISIQASQDAGFIILTVTDDGRGIQLDRVLQKAIAKGLVNEGAKLAPEAIAQLIFAPGLSTRDEVNRFSGRGVGLDIVQSSLQSLGGTVEIRTRFGRGTSFRILIPTTLEIIDGLVLSVDEQLYVVPMSDIVEIIDLNNFVLESVGEKNQAISFRDSIVPVESLRDYIPKHWLSKVAQRAPQKVDLLAQESVALVVRTPDRSRLALRVDRVLSQQQIVVRSLSRNLNHLPGFSGVTILGNGEPGMILSLPQIGEAYLKTVMVDRGVA